MPRLPHGVVAIAALLAAGSAQAADRTAVLDVQNVSCVTCAPIVKRAIGRVSGVTGVTVTEKADGTAVAIVAYDDAKVGPEALAEASTKAGYPARVRAN